MNGNSNSLYELFILKISHLYELIIFLFKKIFFQIIPIVTTLTLIVKTLIIVDEKKLSFLKTLISIICAISTSRFIVKICEEYTMSKLVETLLIILVTIYSDKIARILVMEIDISYWIKLFLKTIFEEIQDLIKSFFKSLKQKFFKNEK